MSHIPHHIAIIMDGNGRWAGKRFLPRLAGHKQGITALERCIEGCVSRGVEVLTVFAFSSENWNRPIEEVSGLMELMLLALGREVPKLKAEGVQIHFVGETAGMSDKVIQGMLTAQQETAANSRLILNVCFNYGGRWDMTQAVARLVATGQAVTEQALADSLALAHVRDPDLLIRTGGEMRLSNFLLWQAAYSELYFSDKLWPEFDDQELDRAITAFNQRERRYGKTSAQLQA
ncbi:MAG: polyprenyl diphosphate synthase [Burkholderiaceae bacterium]